MLVYDDERVKCVEAHEVHFKEEYGYNDEKVNIRWSVTNNVLSLWLLTW